jgi:hypothetical protein
MVSCGILVEATVELQMPAWLIEQQVHEDGQQTLLGGGVGRECALLHARSLQHLIYAAQYVNTVAMHAAFCFRV